MNGRILRVVLASGLIGVFGCVPARVEPEQRNPNILYILADDLGYGDPGSYNPDSKIPTPHIDRLAAEGMRFTDAHSGSAVCTPTRYGILTGRYSWRTRLEEGVLWGYSPALIEEGRVTVPSFLRDQGYRTVGIGKWHLGLGDAEETDYGQVLRPGPLDAGFDRYFGIPASLDMQPYLYIEGDRAVAEPTLTVEESKRRWDGGGGFWRGGPIAPGFRHGDVLPRIEGEALEFLDGYAAESNRQPFFLYVALTAPHTPWVPTPEFEGRSQVGYYGDFVLQVDSLVGALLGKLDELNIAENTLVIFTSDNGAHWRPEDIESYGHRANHQWRGQKADIWEGGHRVPFQARWPGRVPSSSVNHGLIGLNDLLATVAAIVGEELPDGAGEDSRNILPLFLGENPDKAPRDHIVHHSVAGVFAIRRGDWKLILGRGSGGFSEPREYEPGEGEPKGQLYHLAEDPGESQNLYLERPEIVESLSALLEKIRNL